MGLIRQPGGDRVLGAVVTQDPRPDVRVSAARAMARYPTRASVGALIRALGDKDIAVQRRVLLSLESITYQQLGDQPGPWQEHLQTHLGAYPDNVDEALRAQERRRPPPPKRWYQIF